MEIIKEINIRKHDISCIVGAESSFHVRAKGLRNELNGKAVCAKTKDIVMPKLIKNVNFKLYYGEKSLIDGRVKRGLLSKVGEELEKNPNVGEEVEESVEVGVGEVEEPARVVRSTETLVSPVAKQPSTSEEGKVEEPKETESKNVLTNVQMDNLISANIEYISLYELCMKLERLCNVMINGECVLNNHDEHVCQRVPLKKMCQIEYINEMIRVKNASTYVIVMSENIAVICGISECGVQLFSEDEKLIMLEGQCSVGSHVLFLNETERFRHVVMNEIVPRTICSGKSYGILFTHDFMKERTYVDRNTLKRFDCNSDLLRFYVFDDEMKSIGNNNVNWKDMRFTIQFVPF